ncbi:MAG: endonuclease VIII [Sodalis sp. (in: enterobacteria)]
MPEGPEIHRTADDLMQAMSHLPIILAWFSFPHLKRWETHIAGQKIDKIEARGKALLTSFSNGLVLYSHNQLYGVWRIVKAGETPPTKRDLRVRLENQNTAILLYSASEISILSAEKVAEHPFLLHIGPDVLDQKLTAETVQTRLMSKRFSGRQLGALLLDQSFIAGLGNYLRVEILWQARRSAQDRPRDLNEEQKRLLCQAILDIPRLSYATRGKPSAKDNHGVKFRFHVFHCAGKSCERCGKVIEKDSFSGRPFYWCPGCQR